VLIGEYELRVDHKGRIAIPARLREEFRGGLIVARGFDKCLIVYTVPEWAKVAERLASMPLTQLNSRRIGRLVFSGAFDLTLDRQGRVLVPPILRQYAAIDDKAVLIGAYSHLQIWSKELWTAEKQFMVENAVEISEAVET
jgi:MraZ protein